MESVAGEKKKKPDRQMRSVGRRVTKGKRTEEEKSGDIALPSND